MSGDSAGTDSPRRGSGSRSTTPRLITWLRSATLLVNIIGAGALGTALVLINLGAGATSRDEALRHGASLLMAASLAVLVAGGLVVALDRRRNLDRLVRQRTRTLRETEERFNQMAPRTDGHLGARRRPLTYATRP